MVSNESFENVDKITPITGGFNITFGNVLKQINKVIQTIINQFTKTNTTISDTQERIRGISGTFKQTIEVSGTADKTISILSNVPQYYTHGYILVENEGVHYIGYCQPEVNVSKTNNGTYSSNSNGANAYIKVNLSHNDDKSTSLELNVSRGAAKPNDPFYYENYTVRYELY